jgi:osmoprotectant transport system ATP-binding protein
LKPIVFKNVSHRYNDRTSAGIRANESEGTSDDEVLRNLSFDIDENIITVIIGRSGGGKSTLLQIINGLIVPVSGEVFVFGNPLNFDKISELRLQMGYCVQGTGLFPHMTVYDNIYLPAKISNKLKKGVDERIDMLMKQVDLRTEFKSKYPYQLSGGEQQRVGICRAMVLNPGIFLLDEPFGALDPSTRGEIHKEVLKLQQFEPRTIVMVTHDLHEAIKLADKIMLIDKGMIQQYGTKDEILNKPANQFVRDFIGSQYEN